MTTLPEDFLSGPAVNPSLRKIDFSKTPLTEYRGKYAVVIEGVLSPEECIQFVSAAEKNGAWEKAMINVGGGMQVLNEDARKCDRIIWDDQDIMDRLWARVEPLVPELKKLNQNAEMTQLNNRMRILKYGKGEYFRRKLSTSSNLTITLTSIAHYDGSYVTPDESEQSYFTLHLYLNDADHQPEGQKLAGGATTFWSYDKRRVDVEPKMGAILIFQHKGLLHAGDEVLSGTKITLRTDIMYRNLN